MHRALTSTPCNTFGMNCNTNCKHQCPTPLMPFWEQIPVDSFHGLGMRRSSTARWCEIVVSTNLWLRSICQGALKVFQRLVVAQHLTRTPHCMLGFHVFCHASVCSFIPTLNTISQRHNSSYHLFWRQKWESLVIFCILCMWV